MIFTADYHTHTRASDGANTLEENAMVALDNKLKTMSVTDHGFMSIKFHSTPESLKQQREEATLIRQKYGLDVIVGIEANILGDGTLDMSMEDIKNVDQLTIGFHRLLIPAALKHGKDFILVNGFGSLKSREQRIKENTDIMLKVMDNYPVDIIAHLNHRCLVDVKAIAEKAVEKNIYIELNEKHIDTLENDIEILKESGVNFVVGSDAHKKDNVGVFKKVLSFMMKHDVPINRIYGVNHKLCELKPKN